jgi:phosphoheptose isomerase
MLAAMISVIVGAILIAKPNTKISQEIARNIQQSTNIVDALKKENLVIRKAYGGSEADTVEIVVEYDFLYKNSMRK